MGKQYKWAYQARRNTTQSKGNEAKSSLRASAIMSMEKHRMWGTGYEGTQHKARKTTSGISCDMAGMMLPESQNDDNGPHIKNI